MNDIDDTLAQVFVVTYEYETYKVCNHYYVVGVFSDLDDAVEYILATYVKTDDKTQIRDTIIEKKKYKLPLGSKSGEHQVVIHSSNFHNQKIIVNKIK